MLTTESSLGAAELLLRLDDRFSGEGDIAVVMFEVFDCIAGFYYCLEDTISFMVVVEDISPCNERGASAAVIRSRKGMRQRIAAQGLNGMGNVVEQKVRQHKMACRIQV